MMKHIKLEITFWNAATLRIFNTHAALQVAPGSQFYIYFLWRIHGYDIIDLIVKRSRLDVIQETTKCHQSPVQT